MTILPIAERELRVASRKGSTFWVRMSAAAVAVIIGCCFYAYMSFVPFAGATTTMGSTLFAVLVWIAGAVAFSAGLFFTSDCLSEEKREGTLGMLFLTDLKGYDVALGKLLATSLRSFYGLLTLFPVLAVTLMFGGVTAAQFWKTAIALISALFISLSAGLFVSTFSRDAQRAMGATLLLLALLLAGGPLIDLGLAERRNQPFTPVFALSSPAYLLTVASAWGQQTFWSSAAINQLMTVAFLAAACLSLPRTWQDKVQKRSTRIRIRSRDGQSRRAIAQARLLDRDPIMWLSARDRWLSILLWVMSIIMAVTMGWSLWKLGPSGWSNTMSVILSMFSGLFVLIAYLGITSQAARFIVETRRSGFLEMVLSTPMTAGAVVSGHWRALVRLFALPVLVIFSTLFVNQISMQEMTWNAMAAATPAATPPPTTSARSATNSPVTQAAATNNVTVSVSVSPAGVIAAGAGSGHRPSIWWSVGIASMGTFVSLTNLLALACVAMWMGLTSRTSHLAVLKAIVFVQVIPWFVISLVSTLAVSLVLMRTFMNNMAGASPAQTMMIYTLISTSVATVLYLIKNTAFFVWAHRRLKTRFMDHAVFGETIIKTPRKAKGAPPTAPPPLPGPAST